jgi:quercetin dioxygenase-like cupin family protein
VLGGSGIRCRMQSGGAVAQVFGAGASAVPEEPLHIPFDQQQMRYEVLPGGDVEGTRRAVANGIATTSTMVNRLEMPPGQSSPPRRFTGDHVIYHLEGTIEWNVDGVSYRLRPGDLLFIPPNVPYSFSNVGAEIGRFIDVAGRVDDWPPRMLYADGTEISSGSLNQLFN